MNRLIFYLFIVTSLILFSCNQKKYSLLVDGFVYKDCSLSPEKNLHVRIFNNQRDHFNEISTKTDSNGYFTLALSGEGPSEMYIELGYLYTGPISSCRVNAYINDTSSIYINKDTINIKDTLYISLHSINPGSNYYSDSCIYFKLTEKDFNQNALLKINRSKLIANSYDYSSIFSKLWINNDLDVYLVFGNGINEYINVRNQLNKLTLNTTNKIKKIHLKSCLNTKIINL